MEQMQMNIQEHNQYQIEIGKNIFTKSLQQQLQGKKFFLCIDQRVWLFHQEALHPFCNDAIGYLIIEAKEANKTQATIDEIIQLLKQEEADRATVLVAVGGGVIGDLVGFAASIYMRGIPFVQVPTTLLSQVDSSIGGKVAANYDGIKNMLGTFYSPTHVIIDIAFLTTLTERLFKAGLVELLKHGFIVDETIIDTIMTLPTIQALRANDNILLSLIKKSLAVKKMVVEQDFHDTGIRHVLNFGHTFAHALEVSPDVELFHGECVAIGMLVMGLLSENEQVFLKIKAVLARFECIRSLPLVDFSKVLFDKKRNDKQIKEVLLTQIGETKLQPFDVQALITLFDKAYEKLRMMNDLNIVTPAYLFSKKALKGTAKIPPSKSYAHRYIIAAAIAKEPTVLHNMYEIVDDVQITLEAVEKLGVVVQMNQEQGTVTLTPPQMIETTNILQTVFLKESGTSLRLLLPILTHLLGKVRLTGTNKLPYRPLDAYFNTLNDIIFTKEAMDANLPLVCEGEINPGIFSLEGNVSSQFISGLLLLLPLLSGDSEIQLSSPLESIPYVEMTLDVLRQFNITVTVIGNYEKIVIKGNQSYISQGNYDVEQDYSSRGFFEVATSFPQNEIEILPKTTKTLQGDAIVEKIIAADEHKLDLQDVPDTAPIMSIYFTQHGGTLLNTERLQFKESNRLQAIMDFLTTMQIEHTYNQEQNTLAITKGNIQGGIFDTYLDHRITMSLIIASTISKTPIILNEIKSVEKSYSSFMEQYEALGGFIDEK